MMILFLVIVFVIVFFIAGFVVMEEGGDGDDACLFGFLAAAIVTIIAWVVFMIITPNQSSSAPDFPPPIMETQKENGYTNEEYVNTDRSEEKSDEIVVRDKKDWYLLESSPQAKFHYWEITNDDWNCSYIEKEQTIVFECELGKIILPAYKFKINENDSFDKVFIGFKLKEMSRGIREDNIEYVEVRGPKDFWPFSERYQEGQKLRTYNDQKIIEIIPLAPVKNGSNTINTSESYFGIDHPALVSAYSQVSLNFVVGKNSTKPYVTTLGKLYLTVDASLEKPILRIDRSGDIEKWEIISSSKDWPFDYRPNGNYKKVSGDIDKLIVGKHFLVDLSKRNPNRIYAGGYNPVYFIRDGESIRFKWMDNSGEVIESVLPTRKNDQPIMEIITIDTELPPIVEFEFDFGGYGNSPKGVLENNIKKTKLTLSPKDSIF